MSNARELDWRIAVRNGIYTIPEAARLIGTTNPKLQSWIEGNPHAHAAPIIHRQIPRVGGRAVLGFLDLVEARFIRHFTTWFSPQTIRKVSVKLRERHDIDHPFAMDNRFRTDGKAIFIESAETDDERRVLNLMNDNFEMEPVIEQSLFDSIFYVDDLARRWSPDPEAGRVVVDPMICFGHPVIDEVWIPTRKLFDAFLVEGGVDEAAEEFGVDCDVVTQAVRFEQRLDGQTRH